MVRRAGLRRKSATARLPFRVGCGYDVHPFALGRKLVLGGVPIAGSPGLAGHSDADVLSHAICDALLGALGLEEMGVRFPATNRKLRGKSSLVFLRQVMRDVRARGYAIGNLDTVVMAETPRLVTHLPAMRRRLASALGCPAASLSVKAKRGEGIGAIGRREGIAAQAVVLLALAPAAKRRTRAGK